MAWSVECLGEAVPVGVRVAFAVVEAPGTPASTGQLLRVVGRDRETWVARVVRVGRGKLMLAPFSDAEVPALDLAERDARGAERGDRVLVAPLRRDARADVHSRGRRHRGAPRSGGLPVRVVSVLGPAGEPDADHAAVVWKHRLATRFSRRARLEADAIDPAPTADDERHRVDLRHLPFVTIDPATARDHDDAVCVETRPAEPALRVAGAEGGAAGRGPRARTAAWTERLWVAIADVAWCVGEDGFLDAEARRRGNSFYFPDRAIPMLPERLSSDLCSLRPDVDRRAIVVELRLDRTARVVDALFHEAWIRSRARLSYEEAARLVAAGDGALAEAEWGASLTRLDGLSAALGRARVEAGALALELPETQIVIDEAGRAVDARLRERNPAHGWIEEAMLAANRAVARALEIAGRGAIHRVHPTPSPAKLDELADLLERYGVDPGGELDAPGVLARALDAVRGQPSEERIHMAALRSMSQARYTAESGGHYALRFEHYAHFTSPIRRYADLEVHRALRRMIRDVASGEEGDAARERRARVALWLSGRERVAQAAERDAEALASCAMLAGRESERFAAEVVGVTEFGLFVRLAQPAVSGLVPMRALDGRWSLDPEGDALVSDAGDRRVALGAPLDVRLAEVDPDRARLTFAPVGRVGRRDRGARDPARR